MLSAMRQSRFTVVASLPVAFSISSLKEPKLGSFKGFFPFPRPFPAVFPCPASGCLARNAAFHAAVCSAPRGC